MHLIVRHKAWPSVKSRGFTDNLKKPVLIAHSVVQKPKENRKSLKIKDLRFKMYPVDYLFSNQFMEDLAKIYRLRKYFPSFDDDVCQSSIPSSDDSGL